MTVIIQDTPVRKLAVGTSQRAAGDDVITHTWRKNTTSKHTKVCYMIGQGRSRRRVIKTAALPSLLMYHSPSLSRAVDANVRSEEQTCFRTKIGRSGRSQSKMWALRFRCLGRSTSPRTESTDQPQRFGSISAFQGSRHTSPAGTLQSTQPMRSKYRSAPHLSRSHIRDDI